MRDVSERDLLKRIDDLEDRVSMYQAAMLDIYQNSDDEKVKSIISLVYSIDDSFDWQMKLVEAEKETIEKMMLRGEE